MTTPIPYPIINGFRASGNSIELVIAGIKGLRGFKVLDYNRTRSRGMVEGNHPDPLGKTRGKNAYKASCELYLAEWNLLLATLGPGYGDLPFTVISQFSENGFDTITDTLLGCTLDSSTGGGDSTSTDGLLRKFDLNPLKILYNGQDDCEVPLVG